MLRIGNRARLRDRNFGTHRVAIVAIKLMGCKGHQQPVQRRKHLDITIECKTQRDITIECKQFGEDKLPDRSSISLPLSAPQKRERMQKRDRAIGICSAQAFSSSVQWLRDFIPTLMIFMYVFIIPGHPVQRKLSDRMTAAATPSDIYLANRTFMQ